MRYHRPIGPADWRMTLVAIDHAQVRHIARLARLELEEGDDASLARELQSILDHVALLDELDLDAIPKAADTDPHAQPLREDVVKPGLELEAAMSNAPEHGAGHFRVPRVLDE